MDVVDLYIYPKQTGSVVLCMLCCLCSTSLVSVVLVITNRFHIEFTTPVFAVLLVIWAISYVCQQPCLLIQHLLLFFYLGLFVWPTLFISARSVGRAPHSTWSSIYWLVCNDLWRPSTRHLSSGAGESWRPLLSIWGNYECLCWIFAACAQVLFRLGASQPEFSRLSVYGGALVTLRPCSFRCALELYGCYGSKTELNAWLFYCIYIYLVCCHAIC